MKARQKESLARARVQASASQAALHKQEMQEVQARLASFSQAQKNGEQELQRVWKSNDKQRWDHIEYVIKLEESKLRARLDAERKKKEEEERNKREAEEKARLEKEKKLQEELRKKKEQEEKEKQRQQEEEARKQQQEMAKKREEHEKAEEEERKALGMTTALQDWKAGRDYIKVSMRPILRDVPFNELYRG
jgi:nucleoporin GLE1